MSKKRSKVRAKPKGCAAHEHGALAVCFVALLAMGAAMLTFSSGSSISPVQFSRALQERDQAFFGLAEKVVELEKRANKRRGK